MYSCYQRNIIDGKEAFPVGWIISENLLHISLWVLTGALLWPLWRPAGIPVLTILWAVIVVAVQILLKKHNCSGCYYYGKQCHLGWGKLAAVMFPQDSGNPDIGMKLALFYIIPPPVIVITAIVFSIITQASFGYWGMLRLYTILNVATFPARKAGCQQCAMRAVCPGSAAKKEE